MKKHLIIALALCGGLFSLQANAKQLLKSPLERTDWTVKGCSEHNYNGGGDNTDGGLDQIIDGDNNTYWHTSYGNDQSQHNNAMPHYFMIDRGENYGQTPFIGFGYLPRVNGNNGSNGYVTNYRIYVFDEEPTTLNFCPESEENTRSHITDNHASLTTFLEGKEATLSGTFDCDRNNQTTMIMKGGVFEEEQTGRYILFVIDGVNSTDANKHATCAEFYLYSETEEVDSDSEVAKLSPFGALIDASVYEPLIYKVANSVDEATYTPALTEARTKFLSNANGMVFTMSNARRKGDSENPHYLTYNPTTARGITSNTLSEYGKWNLRRVNETEYFRLYNPEGGVFVSSQAKGNGYYDERLFTTDENSGAQFRLIANTSATPGVALQFINSQDGLNVNTSDGVLTHWGYNDGGSSWTLSVMGTRLEDLDTTGETYYRIRSARANSRRTGAGLLGINSVVENNAEIADSHPVVMRKDGLGALWTLHADENGKVIFRNAAAVYSDDTDAYGLVGSNESTNASASLVSSSPVAVEIIKAKTANTNYSHSELGLAIRTHHEGNTNRYMDVANSGNSIPNFNGWDQVNNDFPNNGGIFFFEPVTDADEVISNYLTLGNIDTYLDTINGYAQFPALWDSEAITATIEALNEVTITETPTTVVAANTIWAAQGPSLNNRCHEIIGQLYHTAIDKPVIFINGRGDKNTWYLTTHSDNKTITSNSIRGLETIWWTEDDGNGHIRLKKHTDGKYLKSSNANSIWSVDETIDETLSHFTFLTYKLVDTYALNIRMHGSNQHIYLHDSSNQYSSVANTHVALGWMGNDGEGSHWYTVSAEDDELSDTISCSMKLQDSVHTITIAHESGVSLLTDFTYLDHHNIVVRKINFNTENGEEPSQARMRKAAGYTPDEMTEPYTVSLNNATVTDNGLEIALDSKLPAGDYELYVPTGVINIGDKYNKAVRNTLNINDSGAITGLEELETITHVEKPVIYDLQGRRVSKAVKGVYIINGNKVYVK